jgi:hypothetical protein
MQSPKEFSLSRKKSIWLLLMHSLACMPVVTSFTIDKELADIKQKIWKSVNVFTAKFHRLCPADHLQDV